MKTFYCYLDEDGPEVKEKEPKNFNELPYAKPILAPTYEIACQIYETDLKTMKMREGK